MATACNFCGDPLQNARQLLHDLIDADPQDVIPGPPKHDIAARIRGAATRVTAAIDLDDEPHGWREEVSDEAIDERYLPPKGHAAGAGAKRSPERGFGRRGSGAHAGGALGEQER